jgi:hypothetical protein
VVEAHGAAKNEGSEGLSIAEDGGGIERNNPRTTMMRDSDGIINNATVRPQERDLPAQVVSL